MKSNNVYLYVYVCVCGDLNGMHVYECIILNRLPPFDKCQLFCFGFASLFDNIFDQIACFSINNCVLMLSNFFRCF